MSKMDDLKNPFEDKTEKQIVKHIRRKLEEKYPGVWYKIHGGPYQEAGIPDIVGCYKGHFVGFEVKRPEKVDNVSDQQHFQLSRLSKHGASVAVITSAEQAMSLMERWFKSQ